jgi:hypothetical protein
VIFAVLTGMGHSSRYRFLPVLKALNRHIPTPPQCVDIAARQRIKFDDEQFAALVNELQARG